MLVNDLPLVSCISSHLLFLVYFLVYGFLQTRIVEHERGQGYPFEVGYVKGTGRVFRGRIDEVPGGTASNNYYIKLY